MKTLWLALIFGASVWGGDLSTVIHDPTNATPDTTVSSSYQFSTTPVGNASSIVLRFTNASAFPIQIAAIVVDTQTGVSPASPNFTVTGVALQKTLGVGSAASFEDVTLSFTPQSTGLSTGYLQVTYQIAQNGCSFTSTSPATQCPARTANVSTFTGNGAPSQLALTYLTSSGVLPLTPNSSSPLNFGNVSTSTSSTITFTLENQSGAAIAAPSVSLRNQTFASTAFSLDTSALPASIAAGSSGSFRITFAPGQTGQANAAILIGSSVYPISGTGIALTGTDALQIQFVDSTGVRTLPQAATPISFGQVIAGTNTPAILSFSVTNPTTSFSAVALSPLTVSGTGFALTAGPSIPASIAPGSAITFEVVFSPTQTGTYSGTLTIGNRNFALSGSSINSAVPDATLQIDQQPLTSQHQAHVSVQLAGVSTVDAIGQLSMSFSPNVSGISDDPAIFFVATSGRQLQVSVAAGSQNVTSNGQSALTFQTGTTAGTLTFTLTFPNKAPVTQSFTITPAQVSIASGTAVRQSPNLVVTLSGYDNSYSAGNMAFTFYDTSGNVLTPTPISVDASSGFHQYFFNTSKVGGAFSVQASFPVTGSVTQIGSVRVSISNSSGTTTTTETFQ